MVKLLLFILLFLNCFTFSCQNLKRIENKVSSYAEFNTIQSLSKRIDIDFITEIDKARAIYSWITQNINYDVNNARFLNPPELLIYFDEDDLNRKIKIKKNNKALKTFRKREGICEGFSYLFKNICDLLSIENQLVYGYTKNSLSSIGFYPKEKNHVWNAVKINNKWLIIDATYGSGYFYNNIWQKKINSSFFNVEKEKLKLTHFPSNKFWRDYIGQDKLEDFCNEPFFQEAFLKHNIQILYPKKGLIKISRKNKIRINFKGLRHKRKAIKYIYSHEKKTRIAKIHSNKNFSSLFFKNPKQDTSLHIYIDGELCLEYLIDVY